VLKNNFHPKVNNLVLFTAIGLVLSGETLAQSPNDEAALEEVLVTATRRAASIQDIPLAVTAISEKTLQEANITRLDEYLRLAPGVTYTQGGGAGGNLQMRGVATSPRQAQTQAAVSQFIDEFAADDGAKSINTPDLGIFDINRIELLRGPQGTLFGSGSLSGAIRILTNQPELEQFEGALELSGGFIDDGGEDYSVSGMINIPVVEGRFAIRAVGYFREDGGWIDQVTLGQDEYNENESYGGRILATARLSERWDLTAGIYYQNREIQNQLTLLEPTPAVPDNTRSMTGLVVAGSELENTFYNLRVNYEGDNFNFLSVTTLRDNEFLTFSDLSAIFGNAFPIPYELNGESDSWIQEFRFTSTSDSALEWTVGAFYMDREREVPNAANSPFPLFGTTNIIFNNTITDTLEYALYGELNYRFAEQWTATLGGRWYYTESEGSSETSGILNGFMTTFVEGEQDEDGITPKFALAFDASDSVNIYASVSKGFRTGDWNVVSGGISNISASFDSDSLWNYEVGLKSQFDDSRFTANLALFLIDWEDIQIAQRSLDGFNFTGNAGSAESIGLEVELNFAPTDQLELGASFSVTKAELTEDVTTVIQSDGTAGVRDGDRLPGSPEHTFAAYGRYSFELMGRSGYARADFLYTGSAYTDFSPAAGVEYGSFSSLNLNIGYNISDTINASLYVNNAFDSDDSTSATPAGFLGPGTEMLLRPRTIGATLRVDF